MYTHIPAVISFDWFLYLIWGLAILLGNRMKSAVHTVWTSYFTHTQWGVCMHLCIWVIINVSIVVSNGHYPLKRLTDGSGVHACVTVFERVLIDVSITVGSGHDLLKLRCCDPLGFQQPSLHAKSDRVHVNPLFLVFYHIRSAYIGK